MSRYLLVTWIMLVGLVGCENSARTALLSGEKSTRRGDTPAPRASLRSSPRSTTSAEKACPTSEKSGSPAWLSAGSTASFKPASSDCLSDKRWFLAEFDNPPSSRENANELSLTSTSSTDREAEYLHRAPLGSLRETIKRDVKTMHTDLWHDTKQVYGNPVNLAILGVTYGGSLALQETGPDDTVEDHYTPGHHSLSRGWRNAADAYGNPGTHFAIAGAWYVLGQQLQDDKTYNVGKTLASALIINGVTTMAGQAASWDRAPNGEWGAFPSGHTSSSFCIASVMDRSYGHLVGVPLYGLATIVAVERVDDRNHYFSDVVMGAVLGTVVGHAVASGRDPEIFGWKVLPWADPSGGGTGVAFFKTLD